MPKLSINGLLNAQAKRGRVPIEREIDLEGLENGNDIEDQLEVFQEEAYATFGSSVRTWTRGQREGEPEYAYLIREDVGPKGERRIVCVDCIVEIPEIEEPAPLFEMGDEEVAPEPKKKVTGDVVDLPKPGKGKAGATRGKIDEAEASIFKAGKA